MFACNPDPHFTMESMSFSAHFDFSSSLLPFSPPVFNHDSPLHDLILFPPQLAPADQGPSPLTPPAAPPLHVKETESTPSKKSTTSGSRKRTTRRDRHSKIVTAQGPRDRRMRLNLEVAPQFFDIQDMLGFDKASKTVKWLMKEAKSSIEKLKAAAKGKVVHSLSGGRSSKVSTEGSTSELDQTDDISQVKSPAIQQEDNNTPKAKMVARRPSKRAAYPSSLSRESRAMARARARERTRAKSTISDLQSGRLGDCGSEWNELLSSSSPDLKPSLDLVAEMKEQCSPSINQDSKRLGNGTARVNEPSVSILDYDNTSSLFSEEQWELNHFATQLW